MQNQVLAGTQTSLLSWSLGITEADGRFVVRTIQRSRVMLWCACRYLLRDLVVDYTLKKYPSWAAVDTAVSREGWKLITLLRSDSINQAINEQINLHFLSSGLMRGDRHQQTLTGRFLRMLSLNDKSHAMLL